MVQTIFSLKKQETPFLKQEENQIRNIPLVWN